MAVAVNKSNLLMVVKAKDLPPAELEKQEKRKKAKAKTEKETAAVAAPKEKKKKEKPAEVPVAVIDIAPVKKKKTKKAAVVPVAEPLAEIVVPEVLEQPLEPVKPKKVLPPVPERTEEERAALIVSYSSEEEALIKQHKMEQEFIIYQQKLEQGIKALPPIPKRTGKEYRATRERYKQEEAEYFASLPRRIPACVGKVADNLAPDRPCPGLFPWLKSKFTKVLTDRLLAEPSLVLPTWEILMNNDLTINKKIEQLHTLGWESELLRFDNNKFLRLFVLARILEQGII